MSLSATMHIYGYYELQLQSIRASAADTCAMPRN